MTLRPTARLAAAVQSRIAVSEDPEAGMSTAEYAVGTVAAAACGGVLYKILTSSEFLNLIKHVILGALKLKLGL